MHHRSLLHLDLSCTQAVEEGTIVAVNGRFHSRPFEFEEMRAPHMEIPLARCACLKL